MTYLPHGARGVGSAVAHASDFEVFPDNLQTARDEVYLLVLVENCKGPEALDSILEVDSMVGVFIGPSNLAADMEFIGQAGAAEVKNALVVALQKFVAACKAGGILTMDTECRQNAVMSEPVLSQLRRTSPCLRVTFGRLRQMPLNCLNCPDLGLPRRIHFRRVIWKPGSV